jgi:glutamate/aspartate transport system substrate-binding protein
MLAMMVTIVCVAPAAAMAAQHTGTLKKIKESKTIVLGYRDSSRPFSYVGDDGKPAGYSVDLCIRIAEAVQRELALPELRLRWVKVSPEDRIKAVADGKIDLECGSTTASLSRQAQVDFTITTFIDGGSLLVTDASGIESVKDLGGKRVGLISGTTTETALTKALLTYMVTPQIVAVKDHAEGLAAIENGTADAYASDRVILIGLGRRSKEPAKLSLSPQLFSYEPYGLMLRRGDADFRLTANRALSRLFRSDDIVRIYEKWFGDLGKPSVALLMMYSIAAVPE